nr:Rrf2 family transcriptional regulator [Berryella wangjianweii]
MKPKASIDYGVRAMMYLAINGGTCSSKEISERMDIPRDYLIQLGLKLRNAGLINARPGKNGGYTLARPASEITIHDINEAFDEERKMPRHPLVGNNADREVVERVSLATGFILSSVEWFLGRISIQDLLDASENGETAEKFFERVSGK